MNNFIMDKDRKSGKNPILAGYNSKTSKEKEQAEKRKIQKNIYQQQIETLPYEDDEIGKDNILSKIIKPIKD